jgi:hypothetical protein
LTFHRLGREAVGAVLEQFFQRHALGGIGQDAFQDADPVFHRETAPDHGNGNLVFAQRGHFGQRRDVQGLTHSLHQSQKKCVAPAPRHGAPAPVSGLNRLAAARARAGAAGDTDVGQGAAHVVHQVFRLGRVGDLDVGGFNQNGHFSASFGVFKRMAAPYAKPA